MASEDEMQAAVTRAEAGELASNRYLHLVRVTNKDSDGPAKFLECDECPYMAMWDGRTLNVLVSGDPGFAHSGSW